MEDPHFSYNIFHGNTARELATQIQSKFKVPDGLPKAKGFMKTESSKKPLCDVGNTLANAKRIIKPMPEACKIQESTCSVSELKGLPDSGYQCDDEADVLAKFIDPNQPLDPVPKAVEDNYEDIIPSDKDISEKSIQKMVYLWEQCDIPRQSSWHLDDTSPLPLSPFSGDLMSTELFTNMAELPIPDVVPLIPLTSF